MTLAATELTCPHCGTHNIGLAALFPPASALTSFVDEAQKECPQCHATYDIERSVSVTFEARKVTQAPSREAA